MIKIFQLTVLTLAMTIGVFAQMEVILPNLPMRDFTLTGAQSSPGNFVVPTNQTIDNTYVLDGANEEFSSTLLTTSFNYEGAENHVNGNKIVGGLWNLALYTTAGGYRGSIFGEIRSGDILWMMQPDDVTGTRSTTSVLVVTGGNGDFVDRAAPGNEIYFESITDLQTLATQASANGFRF